MKYVANCAAAGPVNRGLLERRVTATITFPRSSSAAAVPASATGRGWLLVVGVGLVLLCGLVAIVACRRRPETGAASAP
jgi:hypothetical protein